MPYVYYNTNHSPKPRNPYPLGQLFASSVRQKHSEQQFQKQAFGILIILVLACVLGLAVSSPVDSQNQPTTVYLR